MADLLRHSLLIWIILTVILIPICLAFKCGDSMCNNHGTCEINPPEPKPVCTCHSGWSGPECKEVAGNVTGSATSIVPPSTTTHPSGYSSKCEGHTLVCRNGGFCHIVRLRGRDRAQCECPTGWTRNDCSEVCNLTCYNNGKCEERRQTGQIWQECDCLTGYRGTKCHLPCVTHCGKNTCRLQNGTPVCDQPTVPQTTMSMTTNTTKQLTTPATSADISTTKDTSATVTPATSANVSTTKDATRTNTPVTSIKTSTTKDTSITNTPVTSVDISTTKDATSTNTPVTSIKISTTKDATSTNTSITSAYISTTNGSATTAHKPTSASRITKTEKLPTTMMQTEPQSVTSSPPPLNVTKSGADSVVYTKFRLSVLSIICYIAMTLIAFV